MIERIIPGTSIKVRAGAREAETGVTGVVAMPLELDWGASLIHIRSGENVFNKLGYKLSNVELKLVNEAMKYADELYLYRMNESTKATAELATGITATAFHGGVRGNDITVVVSASGGKWTIKTMLDTTEVDSQLVATVADFKANDFITITGEGTLEAKTVKLTTGANGSTKPITDFTNEISKYDYNVLVYTGSDSETKTALKNFVLEERANARNVQAVMSGIVADNKAIYNSTVGLKYTEYELAASEACATMGAIIAKCGIEKSATMYDVEGAIDVVPRLTKEQQETKTLNGETLFVYLHGGVKVLYDINSLTTFADENPKDFRKGLIIRTLDKYATDLQILLDTKVIGEIRNGTNGRNRAKGMIADMTTKNYLGKEYIEDFTADDITIERKSGEAIYVTAGIKPLDTIDKIYVEVIANEGV